jgi:cysteine desulfuration protein SufE
MNTKINEWTEEFSFLDDDDRLVHLIDLAKKPTNLPVELRTDDRLVHGCMSQIWIDVGVQEDLVQVYYDSDAMITKGITSVVADCFSDIPLDEAKQLTKQDFEKLGIKELLSVQRRNGLGSLIQTISTKIKTL